MPNRSEDIYNSGGWRIKLYDAAGNKTDWFDRDEPVLADAMSFAEQCLKDSRECGGDSVNADICPNAPIEVDRWFIYHGSTGRWSSSV